MHELIATNTYNVASEIHFKSQVRGHVDVGIEICSMSKRYLKEDRNVNNEQHVNTIKIEKPTDRSSDDWRKLQANSDV